MGAAIAKAPSTCAAAAQDSRGRRARAPCLAPGCRPGACGTGSDGETWRASPRSRRWDSSWPPGRGSQEIPRGCLPPTRYRWPEPTGCEGRAVRSRGGQRNDRGSARRSGRRSGVSASRWRSGRRRSGVSGSGRRSGGTGSRWRGGGTGSRWRGGGSGSRWRGGGTGSRWRSGRGGRRSGRSGLRRRSGRRARGSGRRGLRRSGRVRRASARRGRGRLLAIRRPRSSGCREAAAQRGDVPRAATGALTPSAPPSCVCRRAGRQPSRRGRGP
jgi:hypothetical protein